MTQNLDDDGWEWWTGKWTDRVRALSRGPVLVPGEGAVPIPVRYIESLGSGLIDGTLPCLYCGGSRDGGQRSVDHVVPRYWGGFDAAWNRVPCCVSCNSSKGTKKASDWIRWHFYFAGSDEAVRRREMARALALKIEAYHDYVLAMRDEIAAGAMDLSADAGEEGAA